jgi:hypothetical protein
MRNCQEKRRVLAVWNDSLCGKKGTRDLSTDKLGQIRKQNDMMFPEPWG